MRAWRTGFAATQRELVDSGHQSCRNVHGPVRHDEWSDTACAQIEQDQNEDSRKKCEETEQQLAKLLLTIFATIVLLAKMPLIGYAARRDAGTTSSGVDLHRAGTQLAVHAVGAARNHGTVCLQTMGLTRYGQCKQQERRFEPPRSVKAISNPGYEPISAILSRGRRTSLKPLAVWPA